MPKLRQSFFVYPIQSKEKFFAEKELFKEKGKWRIEQKNEKKVFLTALAIAIKKDPTTSIRKHTDGLNTVVYYYYTKIFLILLPHSVLKSITV